MSQRWDVLTFALLVIAFVPVISQAQAECGGTIELNQIRGRVLLPDESPAEGATIEIIGYEDLSAYKPPDRIVAKIATDAKGHFNIEGVRPGIYWLVVERNLPTSFTIALKLKSPRNKRKELSRQIEFVLGKEWRTPCAEGTIRLIDPPTCN